VRRPPKGKMLLAALALLVGAASAALPRQGAGFSHPGEQVMKIFMQTKGAG
jgi:hypothetical protein